MYLSERSWVEAAHALVETGVITCGSDRKKTKSEREVKFRYFSLRHVCISMNLLPFEKKNKNFFFPLQSGMNFVDETNFVQVVQNLRHPKVFFPFDVFFFKIKPTNFSVNFIFAKYLIHWLKSICFWSYDFDFIWSGLDTTHRIVVKSLSSILS